MANSLASKMILLVAIFSFGLIACGGDDGDGESGENGGDQPNTSVASYPNSDVMAEVDWAAGQRELESVRFVDLRSTDEYAASHIIGAVNADPARLGYGTNALPDKESVEAVVREWGVTADTTIILYDTVISDAATWVFWVLDTYGHGDLRILNGGFLAWQVADRSIVSDIPQFALSNYSLSNADSNRIATADWVNDHRGDSGVVVVDARIPEVYQGIEGGGHIQGAMNITGDLAYENGAVREPSEIADLFDEGALDNASTVVVYDTDGTRGSMTYYALRVEGKNVRLYAGGWNEWSSRGLPAATGFE